MSRVNENIGLDVGIASVFISYSLIIMALGIWGYGILPNKCTLDDVRNSLRLVIICGAVMTTVFVSYGLCSASCRLNEEPKYDVPTWLLLFVVVVSILSITMIKKSYDTMNNNPKKCQTGGFPTWKKASNLVMGIEIIVVILLFVILGYRMYKKGQEARLEKESQL